MASSDAKLIMAGNSLGEPLDVPHRSKEWLRKADLVVFEDAKGARAALKSAQIHRDFLVFSEHLEKDTLAEIKKSLSKGKTVLYMSDQGMPNLADPGKELVKLAFEMAVKIEVIPGPSAITAALSACPFFHDRFFYYGFLPREDEQRIAELRKFAASKTPTVLMDTPYRLKQVADACAKSFEPTREILLALDITGPDENFILLTAADLPKRVELFEKKLNFVMVISGQP